MNGFVGTITKRVNLLINPAKTESAHAQRGGAGSNRGIAIHMHAYTHACVCHSISTRARTRLAMGACTKRRMRVCMYHYTRPACIHYNTRKLARARSRPYARTYTRKNMHGHTSLQVLNGQADLFVRFSICIKECCCCKRRASSQSTRPSIHQRVYVCLVSQR